MVDSGPFPLDALDAGGRALRALWHPGTTMPSPPGSAPPVDYDSLVEDRRDWWRLRAALVGGAMVAALSAAELGELARQAARREASR